MEMGSPTAPCPATSTLPVLILRGTGHDENARYSEDAETWARMMDRLKRSIECGQIIPKPMIDKIEGATIGIIAFGSTEPAIREARDHSKEKQHTADSMRLRCPFYR